MASTCKAPSVPSVVIPVYNEQDTIDEVVAKVCDVELGLIAKEIVISDDGSTDESPRVIREVCADSTQSIEVHASPMNLGKEAAVRLGLSYAAGGIVIIRS